MFNFKENIYLKIFSLTTILGFIIWVILLAFFNSGTQGELFFNGINPVHDTFRDFINPINYVKDNLVYESLHDSLRQWTVYAPTAFFIFKIISQFINNISNNYFDNAVFLTCSLLLTFISILIAFVIYNNTNAKNYIDKILLTSAFFTSGVYLFIFERANTILLSVFLCSFFIFYYNSKNKILKELSLISLAFAFALKLSPAILGLLLIYKKDYKSVVRTFIYSVLLFVLPALTFPRELETFITFKENILLFTNHMSTAISPYYLSLGKGFLFLFFKANRHIINYFIYFLVLINIFCTFFTKEYWRKVLALVFAMILIPNVSLNYTSLYLFPVLILFFNDNKNSKLNISYLVYFIILFSSIQVFSGTITLALKHIIFLLFFFSEVIYTTSYFFKNNCIEEIKSNINLKINLIKYIFKNKNQKTIFEKNIGINIAFILTSIIIFLSGAILYINNYKYVKYDIDNIADSRNIINENFVLLEDFVIRADIIYSANNENDILFSTANFNNGITFKIENNNILVIYNTLQNERNALLANDAIQGEKQRIKAQITNKTMSLLFQSLKNDKWDDIYLGKNIVLISQDSIKNLIINPKLVENINFEIRYGNNSTILVILTLVLSILPLVFMIYFRPIRKYLKHKNRS